MNPAPESHEAAGRAGESTAYVGTELPLFAKAINWKHYFAGTLKRYIRGAVLEVGAGFGGTAPFMMTPEVRSWTALEPDPALASGIVAHMRQSGVGLEPTVVVGAVDFLPTDRKYDCITYIDVLEHIEHDAEELRAAAGLLSNGGHLIVLSPAFQWLYSPFDRAVGHYRRYTKGRLRAVGPPGLVPVAFYYLDSVGVAASVANRMILRSSSPTISQITFWDRRMVPVSRWVDPLVGYLFGRSVIGVWRRGR